MLTMKKILEEQISKDRIYYNTINHISEKESYIKIWRYSLMSICLLLVITVGLNINNSNKKILDSIIINERKGVINNYKVDGIVQDIYDTDNINQSSNYNADSSISTKDMQLDISNWIIPSNFSLNKKQKVYVKNRSDEYDNSYKYYLIYINDKDNSKIIISYTNKFLKDFSLKDNDILSVSVINGYNVEIVKEGNIYLAIFEYNNLNFNIESENVLEKEFIDLLKSILK